VERVTSEEEDAEDWSSRAVSTLFHISNDIHTHFTEDIFKRGLVNLQINFKLE